MICKFYEVGKYKGKINFYLFYGENEGQKIDVIQSNFNEFTKENTFKYNEKEIIENKQLLFENIYSKSFFENEKLILVSEVTDKSVDLIKQIISDNISDVKIVLIAKRLDKKSKIRNLFEKEKIALIVPFYEDSPQTLITIAKKILTENKINLSQENLNLIIERAQGDRINLKNELQKIVLLSKGEKKIDLNDIFKLTNLSENYSANELVDNCLCKNKKKTLNILNENIPSSEDNILILRTFLNKLKRLRKLRLSLRESNNVDQTINAFKPPIFWKDKDIIKNQLKFWSRDEILNLINEINELEIKVKKNISQPIIILVDFLLSKAKTNNFS